MNDSPIDAYAKNFSHIYVETQVLGSPRAKRIIEHFQGSTVVECHSYKDLFNRSNQVPSMQRHSRSLILAKGNAAIYPGAQVCQSFGNEHFYYTSCVMNCLYDCEYCYLQGMYRSSNLVMFMDLTDTFRELDALLAKHPVYLCISYDTDLLALESLTGYLSEWCDYLSTRPTCTVEVRTKCASLTALKSLPVLPNMILAYTMSPQKVIDSYEHGTASLEKRIEAAAFAIEAGRPVRLCFDPMLRVPAFEEVYTTMFRQIFEKISGRALYDVSVGVFRISKDYLKNMRDARPCGITYYPYTLTNGVYHYDDKTEQALLSLARRELLPHISEERIFFWEG